MKRKKQLTKDEMIFALTGVPVGTSDDWIKNELRKIQTIKKIRKNIIN